MWCFYTCAHLSLLEENRAGLLEFEDDLCHHADVQLLGLFGRVDAHAFDEHRQEVSGPRGDAREHLTGNRARRHADDVSIVEEALRIDAGAGYVLIVDAQSLFQQAHRGGRRLARAHLRPLLRSDLHRPFERAFTFTTSEGL